MSGEVNMFSDGYVLLNPDGTVGMDQECCNCEITPIYYIATPCNCCVHGVPNCGSIYVPDYLVTATTKYFQHSNVCFKVDTSHQQTATPDPNCIVTPSSFYSSCEDCCLAIVGNCGVVDCGEFWRGGSIYFYRKSWFKAFTINLYDADDGSGTTDDCPSAPDISEDCSFSSLSGNVRTTESVGFVGQIWFEGVATFSHCINSFTAMYLSGPTLFFVGGNSTYNSIINGSCENLPVVFREAFCNNWIVIEGYLEIIVNRTGNDILYNVKIKRANGTTVFSTFIRTAICEQSFSFENHYRNSTVVGTLNIFECGIRCLRCDIRSFTANENGNEGADQETRLTPNNLFCEI